MELVFFEMELNFEKVTHIVRVETVRHKRWRNLFGFNPTRLVTTAQKSSVKADSTRRATIYHIHDHLTRRLSPTFIGNPEELYYP